MIKAIWSLGDEPSTHVVVTLIPSYRAEVKGDKAEDKEKIMDSRRILGYL